MYNFGLTPIDTAFGFFGLQVAQNIFQLFFQETKLGIALLFVGFIFSLIRSLKNQQMRAFISYLLGVCFFISIFLVSQTLSDIKSYQEKNNSSTHLTTAEALILPIDKKIPVVLSSIDSFLNNLSFAVIDSVNSIFFLDLSFIKEPFSVQILALNNKKELSKGLSNLDLHYRLIGFVNDEFWPTYILSNDKSLYPDDRRVENGYSKLGKERWQIIKKDITNYIEQDPQWQKTIQLLNTSQDNPYQSYQDQIQHTIISHTVKPIRFTYLDMCADKFLKIWPYIIGSINAAVWVCFPLIAISLLFFPNLKIVIMWVKGLIWSKSLWVFSSLAFAASVVSTRFLQEDPSSAVWMWEGVTLSIITILLIILMTTVSFVLLIRTQ